jgi:glucose dehydrogenase
VTSALDDAQTGKELWRFDPKVDRDERAARLLRHRHPRHRRVEGQDLLIGALDGRLIALDAQDRQANLERQHLSTRTGPIRSPARRACSTARS